MLILNENPNRPDPAEGEFICYQYITMEGGEPYYNTYTVTKCRGIKHSTSKYSKRVNRLDPNMKSKTPERQENDLKQYLAKLTPEEWEVLLNENRPRVRNIEI